MNNLIRKIEYCRLKQRNLYAKLNFIKYPLIFVGNFVIIWYLSRDKEKSSIIFQNFKGLCISVHNKNINVKFILRNVIDKNIIEKDIFFWSLNNVFISLKKNNIRFYRSNNLFYLRKKQRKKSRFIVK